MKSYKEWVNVLVFAKLVIPFSYVKGKGFSTIATCLSLLSQFNLRNLSVSFNVIALSSMEVSDVLEPLPFRLMGLIYTVHIQWPSSLARCCLRQKLGSLESALLRRRRGRTQFNDLCPSAAGRDWPMSILYCFIFSYRLLLVRRFGGEEIRGPCALLLFLFHSLTFICNRTTKKRIKLKIKSENLLGSSSELENIPLHCPLSACQ